MMNGTLFSPPHPSIARQEPSPDNDAAWRQYINTTIFQLSREEVIKLGKDPNTAARLDPEYWGVGDNVYYGKFDISHEIHCLDELRRATFAGYPGYHPEGHHDGTDDSVNWIHLGHCVDMLLQFLMCNADTAVLTMSYVEGQEAPWPDFNINRQCRDYNTLEEWAKTRAIDAWKMDNAPRPRDAHLWPNPLRQDNVDSELGFPLGDHHQQEGHPELVRGL
ncbi:hypothetical protein BDW42DRAFT_186756 [Aspergillus taichungensis]|uniref:Tat pathway signal sequence n=1 Tax=Aspergillus taichungensis TaxID=482145 RepID=A0A2J5HQD0_9EURO|nr:hypothetical protein BDW42DRAFT_186756 [Aspergillus taichungensis]